MYREYKIRVGSNNPHSGGVTVNISKVTRDSEYNEKTGDNDIAIVELSTLLEFNEFIQSVPVKRVTHFPITEIVQPAVGKYDSKFWKQIMLIPPKLCKERYHVTVAKDKSCFVLHGANGSLECTVCAECKLNSRYTI